MLYSDNVQFRSARLGTEIFLSKEFPLGVTKPAWYLVMQMQILGVYRPYKESISKEMNNDIELNLHSMTKLSGCLRYCRLLPRPTVFANCYFIRTNLPTFFIAQ